MGASQPFAALRATPALRDEAREEEPDDGYSRSSSRSTNRIRFRGGEKR